MTRKRISKTIWPKTTRKFQKKRKISKFDEKTKKKFWKKQKFSKFLWKNTKNWKRVGKLGAKTKFSDKILTRNANFLKQKPKTTRTFREKSKTVKNFATKSKKFYSKRTFTIKKYPRQREVVKRRKFLQNLIRKPKNCVYFLKILHKNETFPTKLTRNNETFSKKRRHFGKFRTKPKNRDKFSAFPQKTTPPIKISIRNNFTTRQKNQPRQKYPAKFRPKNRKIGSNPQKIAS